MADAAALTNVLLGVIAGLVALLTVLLGFVLNTIAAPRNELTAVRGDVRTLSTRMDDRFDRLIDRIDGRNRPSDTALVGEPPEAPGQYTQRGPRPTRTERPAPG